MKHSLIGFIFIAIAALSLHSCKKDCPTKNFSEQPIFVFAADSIPADNATETELKISISINASKDRRKLKLSAINGQIKDAKDGEKEIEATVDFDNSCVYTALAKIISPSTSGWVKITAKIDNKEFVDSIWAYNSTVAKIKLTSNSFAVKADFGSDLTISGKLTNVSGGNVSKGYKVTFFDYYDNAMLTPINGQKRDVRTTSDAAGTVSLTYSPGFVPFGVPFFIKAVVSNPDGTDISPVIQDSIRLFIIENK